MPAVGIDATALSHFARAGQLGVLEAVTRPWVRRVTTQAVSSELANGPEVVVDAFRAAAWIEVVPVDDLAELRAVIRFANMLSAGERDLGEATVLGWSQVNGAVALVDEDTARQVGRREGVEVHGSLWFLHDGVVRLSLTEGEAAVVVDRLRLAGMYLPCDGAGFMRWCAANGL
jgi:predicted nucleic acid-binding protein